MPAPGYPAASAAAPAIRDYFTRLAEASGTTGVSTAVPDFLAIERLVDAAFWASLRREEGYVPKISLALVSPDDAIQPMRFERSMPLTAAALAKVAPAVERPGIHLGVWPALGSLGSPGSQGSQGSLGSTDTASSDIVGELRVWGTARGISRVCLVLEVAAPGLIVVKHHRGEGGKFVNVAVLEGDAVKIIDEQASKLPDCPELVTSLLGFESPGSWEDVNVLVQLAASMRAHKRGGAMLIVPTGSALWRESIVEPVPYSVAPPFAELSELVTVQGDQRDRGWQDALDDAVSAVAGLTAVDGATVLSDRYELLAFGVKLARRKGSAPVERIAVTEPIAGGTKAVLHPNRMGGTRHLSAAQFVHDQRDTVALVASQDGRFTVFAWSPCEDLVHAHRVEALLL